MELKVRQFLRGRLRLPASLGTTLVRLHEWAITVASSGIEATLNGASGLLAASSGIEAIEFIGESLTTGQKGLERELMMKSIQEALFYCTGTNPDISFLQWKGRLLRYLDQRGPSTFVQRFLSLALFNSVWFQTRESFRPGAHSPDRFRNDMYEVERICQRACGACWRSMKLKHRKLELADAQQLLRDIEMKLYS